MRFSHRIWAGILLGIVAGNAIGLGSYMMLTAEQPEAAETPTAGPLLVDPASKSHRLAGLDAIEQGDYESAIREFSAGLRVPNPAPDLTQLLSIAQNMREKELARQIAAAEARAEEEAVPPEPPPETLPEPTEVQREERPALLLITTRPDKLAIEIDGELRDMSPARIEVDPGKHRIVFRQGKEKLETRTVTVEAGKATLIDIDVTEKLEPPEAVAAAAVRTVPNGPGTQDTDDFVDDLAEPDDAAAGRDNPDRLGFPYPTTPPAAPAGRADLTPPEPRAALPTARVDAGVVTTPTRNQSDEPAISAAAVRAAAARAQPKFQACYDRVRRRRPRLSGRVMMTVYVDGQGEVETARIAKTTIRSASMKDCLSRAARRMDFPRPVGGGPTSVSFNLRFEPGQ